LAVSMKNFMGNSLLLLWMVDCARAHRTLLPVPEC